MISLWAEPGEGHAMLLRHAAIRALVDCGCDHHHRLGAALHAAANDLDPALDEESEIEEAEQELDNSGRNAGYWPKIKEKLLSLSSSQDAEEAVREWVYTDMWVKDDGDCELCGYHPIKYHFKIENQITRNVLVVGSECIYNYLTIPGVPDPMVLKRRLNQLRTRMKADAAGLSSNDSTRQFQEIEMLERSLYQRVQVLASPEKDFDAKDVERSLAEVVRLYTSLKFVPTGTFKSCQEASKALGKMVKFIDVVRKRAKILQGYSVGQTISAIMRLRADEDKKANLVKLKGFVDDVGKLGSLAEVVSRGWDSLRESRDAITDSIERDLQKASQQLEGRYADELQFLQHYEYLYYTLKNAVLIQKSEMNTSARAAIDYIQSDEFLSSSTLGRQIPSFTPQTVLGGSSNRLIHAGEQITRIVDTVRGNRAKWAYEAVVRQGYDLTQAEVFRIWLECLDEGVLSTEDAEPDKLVDQFNSPAVQKIARKIAPKAIPDEGLTVIEAMTKAWRVDVEAAWKRMSPENTWEADFCRDLTAKFLTGRQTALTFNQMGVIKRKLQGKPATPNMWEEMERQLEARYVRTKSAEVEAQPTDSYSMWRSP